MLTWWLTEIFHLLLAWLMKGLRVDDDAEIPDLKEKLRGAITATR